MDKFKGNVKELRGVFNVPCKKNIEGNIQQQICNSSKNQFEKTNGKCNLFGLFLHRRCANCDVVFKSKWYIQS